MGEQAKHSKSRHLAGLVKGMGFTGFPSLGHLCNVLSEHPVPCPAFWYT